MKKVSKQSQRMEASQVSPSMTMGLDMGDRFIPYPAVELLKMP